MNVVCRWPGSSHNATIFKNAALKVQCEEGAFGNRWLIGNCAYPCTSYLLTPLLNPSSSAEHRYNEAHITTRITIESVLVFGKGASQYLALHTTQSVIIATSVLHNISRLYNISDVEPEVDLPHDSTDIPCAEGVGQHNHNFRQELINNYLNV